MKLLLAPLWAEGLKIRRSKMLPLSILAALFIPALLGVMVLLSKDPALAAKLGVMSAKASIVKDADWPSFLALLSQLIAGAGAIGFGFVTAWVFGREYSDRTVKDLLALPVPRWAIVLAKFAAAAAWCAVLATACLAAGLLAGWAVGLSGWAMDLAWHNVAVFAITALLTLLLCPVVAFLASAGRGYLPPLGFVILTVITAEFAGVIGLGPYFPWAIPGLFSVADTAAGMQPLAVSYPILALTCLAGFAATLAWWQYADQH